MKKILMVVDPQVDFITGTLPIPGADEAMDALAQYIASKAADYQCIIITADHHPFNHCSFKVAGGPWPRHCVHDSVGAAVWTPLMGALYGAKVPSVFLYKGLDPDTEEYSIFKNARSAAEIDRLIKEYGIDRIDVCGLSGDICVSDTLTDGIRKYGPGLFAVLTRFSPSLDGGKRLNEIILENNLPCDR